MKIKILNILSVMLLGMLLMFSSCEEKDDYDYNAIEPIITSIVGAPMVAAHGLQEFPTRYHVAHRGGSTFNWTVTSPAGNAIIVKDSTYESIVYITFPQSSDTADATITVIETTMGGKVSPAFSRNIVLTPFCPYDMDALAGEWTGTSVDHDPVLVASATANLNELNITGLAGFVNFAWGENWTNGNGSCILEFSCGNLIDIAPQWIGDSDYPDVYGIIGGGTYDPVNETISLTYEVFYSWTGTGGSSAGVIETVLSRSGEVISQKVNSQIGDKIP